MTRKHLSKTLLAALLGIAAFALPLTTALARPSSSPHASTPTGIYNNGVYVGPNLSPAQKTKEAVRDAQIRNDLALLKANTIMTQAQKQAKFASLMKSYQGDLLAILTPAQRKEFIAQSNLINQKRQAFMKAHQADIAEANQLEQKIQATYTPDENARMAAIAQTANAQAQQITGDAKLSAASKQKKLKALSDETQRKMLDVLNKSQRADLEKLLKLQNSLKKAAAQNG